jgi:hypothetical protein
MPRSVFEFCQIFIDFLKWQFYIHTWLNVLRFCSLKWTVQQKDASKIVKIDRDCFTVVFCQGVFVFKGPHALIAQFQQLKTLKGL